MEPGKFGKVRATISTPGIFPNSFFNAFIAPLSELFNVALFKKSIWRIQPRSA